MNRFLNRLLAVVSLLVMPVSAFAGLEGDFNGDGEWDTVEICNMVEVCITDASGTRVYTDPNWNSVSLMRSADMDGEIGDEILVSAIEGTTTNTLVVIADATHSKKRYRESDWATYTLVDLVDTDGMNGRDAVLLVNNGQQSRLVIISYPDDGLRTYQDNSWASFAYFRASQLTPSDGNELVAINVQPGVPPQIFVIDDTNGDVQKYTDPNWHLIDIFDFADTNGAPEREIVFNYAFSSGPAGIGIIDPTTRDLRQYALPLMKYIYISDIVDYNGDGSDDVCVFWDAGNDSGLTIIDDKFRAKFAVDSCENYANSGTEYYERPPTAKIASISGPRVVDYVLEFRGGGSKRTNIPGRSLTYHWTFGDGKSGKGGLVTHAYKNPGTYKVTIRTYDGKLWSDPVSQNITIKSIIEPILSVRSTHACISNYWEYIARWSAGDSSPVSKFVSQVNADGYGYSAMTNGPETFAKFFAHTGATALVRVKACNSAGCSKWAQTSISVPKYCTIL